MTGLNEALNEAAAIIKASIGRMMNEEEKLLSGERKSVKGAGNTKFLSHSLSLFCSHSHGRATDKTECQAQSRQMFELITVTIIIYTITSVTSNII